MHTLVWPLIMIALGILLVQRDIRKQLLRSEHTDWDMYNSHAPPILRKYHEAPASMNQTMLAELSKLLGSDIYSRDLAWFAENAVFGVHRTHDGFVLQSYKLKQPYAARQGHVYVFSCGWSETVLKYTAVIRRLYDSGASVYAFDMRGQGFSESTGWRDGRVTHIGEFEYAQDLQSFVLREVRPEVGAVGEGTGRSLVYIGNSLGGLVGISAQLTHAHAHSADTDTDNTDNTDNSPSAGTASASAGKPGKAAVLFDKLVLVAPCIQPAAAGPFLGAVLEALYWAVPPLRDALMLRVKRKTLPKDASHNEEFLDWWEAFRRLAPRQLIIAGPSVGWLRNVYQAGVATYTQKGIHVDHTDVLVISGTSDLLVSTDKIHAFYDHISELPAGQTKYMQDAHTSPDRPVFLFAEHSVSSTNAHRRHVVIQDGRHELWAETLPVVDLMLEEVRAFVARARPNLYGSPREGSEDNATQRGSTGEGGESK